MPKALPEIKVFLSDPAHQQDKDFFFSLFDAYLIDRAAKEKEARGKADGEKTLLQRIFDSE